MSCAYVEACAEVDGFAAVEFFLDVCLELWPQRKQRGEREYLARCSDMNTQARSPTPPPLLHMAIRPSLTPQVAPTSFVTFLKRVRKRNPVKGPAMSRRLFP